MNEQLYRDLDYCICCYNCRFAAKRPHISRGDVLEKLLKPYLGSDGRIQMSKFFALIQSK